MRAVLDTNIIVSQAISPHGAPARIFRRWQQRAFELLVTRAILEEYADALARPSIQRRSEMTDAAVSEVIASLSAFATFVEPARWIRGVSSDPDDDIFLACALAGNADYIVTGDQHLLELEMFQGIPIIRPALFAAILDHIDES